MKKLMMVAAGILLLPLTLSSLICLPSLYVALASQFSSVIPFFIGAALYLIFFEIIFSRPMRTYVFGHELTHALASAAMGGKIYSFKVAKHGGHVQISNTNFLVALAPYCIPLYTLFVLLIYFVLGFWLPIEKYHPLFLGIVGLTLAFHGSLTVYAIRQGQPDLQKTGFFFSIIFIILVNVWVMAILSKLLFWDMISFKSFFLEVMKTQFVMLKWIGVHGYQWLTQIIPDLFF